MIVRLCLQRDSVARVHLRQLILVLRRGTTAVIFFHICMLLQLYHQLSIYIVLVGVEVWEASDQINVDGSDRTQTIADFCVYRRNNINPVHNNDHAQLFT